MKIILFFFVITLSINAYADRFLSEPLCFSPSEPLMFSPYNYIDRYNKDVIKYRQCINHFITEEENEIKLHKKSIQQARQLLKTYKEKPNKSNLSFKNIK